MLTPKVRRLHLVGKLAAIGRVVAAGIMVARSTVTSRIPHVVNSDWPVATGLGHHLSSVAALVADVWKLRILKT